MSTPTEDHAPTALRERSEALCSVTRGRELSLQRLLDGELLVSAPTPAARCDASGRCEVLAASALSRLIPFDARTTAAAGAWEREAWLTIHRTSGEGNDGTVLRLRSGRWQRADRTERGWRPVYVRMSASSDGRIVGIATFEVDGLRATPAQIERGPSNLYRMDVLAGPRAPELPAIAETDTPADVITMAGGVTHVLIERVENRAARMLVLRSVPGGSGAASIELPVPPGCEPAGTVHDDIDAARDGAMFVSGGRRCGARRSGYLARIDGERAESIEVAAPIGPIETLAVEPGGTVWVADAREMYVRMPAGEWLHAALPADLRDQGCRTVQLAARDTGDVFVVAECANAGRVLLRTRCPSPVLPNLNVALPEGTAPRLSPR